MIAARAFGDAVSLYKRLLESAKGTPMAEQSAYRLAVAYHNLKEYEASAEVFKGLLKAFPKSAYAAEAYLRIGDNYLRKRKEPIKAIQYYEGAYKNASTGPLSGRALRGLALARLETKDLEGAADTFLRVIADHPEVALDADLYAWVGQHLFDRERWTEAAVAFQALAERTPEYPNLDRVLFKIAESNEKAGNIEQALVEYATVVKTVPRGAMAVDAQYHMGLLHERAKRFDEAIRLYGEAADTNSGNTAALVGDRRVSHDQTIPNHPSFA